MVLIGVYDDDVKYLLRYLYDLGAREGDFEILAFGWLKQHFLEKGEEIYKIQTVLKGSIQFDFIGEIGEFGQSIKDQIQEYFKTSTVSNYIFNEFDSVLLGAHALKNLIESGENYTNQDNIIKEIRRVKFIGATGKVSIKDSTNDREFLP